MKHGKRQQHVVKNEQQRELGKHNRHSKPRVVVIGLGYVGFPVACAIAKSRKYEVYGYDIDKEKVAKVNKRIAPVDGEQASEDLKSVKIHATSDSSVLAGASYILICVPTPVDENKNPDLTPVIKSAQAIAKHLKKGQMIILESTVNPGVCEEIILPILEKEGMKGGKDFDLAHCPERINPGDTKWNVYNIPRNVGALTLEGTKKAASFYRSFLKGKVTEVSSLKVAEATKIIENTFRDINIAYVNELAKSFDKLGIDLHEVIRGASSKPFAFMPHYPGCGVGGHCIPVDPYYLIEKAQHAGFEHRFLRVARAVNNGMPHYTVEKLMKALNHLHIKVKEAKIGVLGLSYKADIGDIRESPALEIIHELQEKGAKVKYYDPYCRKQSNASLAEILSHCHAVIVTVAHKEFLSITDWKHVLIIIDGRNCLNEQDVERKGIYYRGIGRGK